MTTQTYTMTGNFGNAEPNKVVATFTRVLPDDASKQKRDAAVMDYMRDLSVRAEALLVVDPALLTSLWEWAFFAGQDHSGDTIKALKNEISQLHEYYQKPTKRKGR